jgi:elongation factor Ts
MDSYIHVQGGRGVNVVVVEMNGASEELAHDIAVHIAFARPTYLTREEVPADVIAAERATLETATRNEGKPEAAIAKIVEGRLNGFFKEIVLLEQPYAKDDKKSVKDVIGKASIVRYSQVFIG